MKNMKNEICIRPLADWARNSLSLTLDGGRHGLHPLARDSRWPDWGGGHLPLPPAEGPGPGGGASD